MNQYTVNFPIAGILGLIFITLKLTDYIDWSWLWVLAPFWLPISAVLGVVLIMVLWVLAKRGIRRCS